MAEVPDPEVDEGLGMDTTTVDHTAAAIEILEALNRRDLEDAAARLHPEYRASWPDTDLDGHDAFAREIAMLTGLPDTHFAIERATALVDGRVLVEATVSGTHTGELALPYGVAVEATGRAVSLPFLFVMSFVDGLLHRERLAFDHLGLLAQIGAVPTA